MKNSDEKGHGEVTVGSGFDNDSFFVHLGMEYKGYVEYGPPLHFRGQVLYPVVKVYGEAILPTIRPTILPTLEPVNEITIGQFSITIDAPELGAASVPLRWFAVPATTHVFPTLRPTIEPTIRPTIRPTIEPTIRPTIRPTIEPTIRPTIQPTIQPTIRPTILPTVAPPIRPLVEVTGIGETYAARLKENGITGVKELAEAEPGKISEILGVTEVKAMSFIDEARRLLGQ